MKELSFSFKGSLPACGVNETSIPVRSLTKSVMDDPLHENEETMALVPDVGELLGCSVSSVYERTCNS